MPFRNRTALVGHGDRELRQAALEVAAAGLAALDPTRAVRAALRMEGDTLTVAGHIYDLDRVGRIVVLGAGKASLRVVQGVEEVLDGRIHEGLVVVPHGQEASLCHVEIVRSDHPVPSERSLRAATRLLELAETIGADDLVIAAVTGGSSALVSYPPDGVTFAEKRELHRLLLASGADITEINAVRKHVSAIKGGRLAARLVPARILNLTVSDVAGDPEDCITDLTVQDRSTAKEAIEVLHRYGLWERVAGSIRRHLQHSPDARSPDLSSVDIATVMLVTGATGCGAMAERGRQLGFEPVVLGDSLNGESREAAARLARIVREKAYEGRPLHRPYILMGCGGETTVTLPAASMGNPFSFGEGGPNQDLALHLAVELRGERFAGVSLDTDGSDGGTAAAGAVVDGQTASRAATCGVDLQQALYSHGSRAALRILDDLVETGPTYTNVNDLFALVVV